MSKPWSQNVNGSPLRLLVIVMLVHRARPVPFPESAPIQRAGFTGHTDNVECPGRMYLVRTGNPGIVRGAVMSIEEEIHMRKTYQAVEVSAPGTLRVVERPIPELGAGQVRIRVFDSFPRYQAT